MNFARISELVERHELPCYRSAQLREAFFKHNLATFGEITTLPKAVRRALESHGPAMVVQPHTVLVSRDKRAHKALLRLEDGQLVETVMLNPKPGLWSCCISSQVGCLMKCSFCATGLMGLTRNLSSEEITDQVLFWRQYITSKRMAARLRNVVYMGMGEPFHNKGHVFESLRELTNPDTFAIGDRNISVSTCGLIPPIYEMADTFPQVNLAISLHAATDELRRRLMPVNKAYPLAELRQAIGYHMERTNRKLFFEYILLAGENDSADHARDLVAYLRQFERRQLVHVNLIVFNPTETPHGPSSRETARAFRNVVAGNGFQVTIRRNLGRDIQGACGQLALKT